MSFKTSSVHKKDNRLFSSSKHETSPYYSRSSQSKQPHDQENDYSNGYFESGVDQRKYQTVQKQEVAPFIKDSYYSNAVSEYLPSEYGTNEDVKRKTRIEGKTILDSAYTTSSKGYSQLMKEKNARGSKYPGSEKKTAIVRGQDSESKNGQNNSHLRRKSYSGQSSKERTPVKRIPSSISAKPSTNQKNFNREELQLDFHHEESFGEDKFMAYTRTLESDLDQVSLRLASSIRNDFEKTAHNILHQHINKHSSIEKDETYRSRENTNITPRDRPDLGFSEQSPYRSFDYNKRINLSVEKKIIQERYEEEDIKQIPEVKEEKSVIVGESEKNDWMRSEKKVGANGVKKVQKEFKSESKNNRNLEANKTNKGLVSNEKKTIIKGQTAQKEAYSSKKPVQGRQREIEPVRNIEKQLFSPPMKSPSAGNEYGMSSQLLNSYGNNMTSASQRQEGIYAQLALLDDLQVDQKISKLQEISIQLMKDHHYDDALDYLLEADVLIRNDLPTNHPQQIYIHYLLGECFVKKGDYFRAQKVLGNAIIKYEENDREYIKDSKHASYYLGLLVLQSHVFMSTKQFGHALEAYKKLVKGVENYCLTYERQNLKGIIPHILLIKYNMGECLKSLERREEVDIIFREVVTKFNIQDQEQSENFAILLNIGEHFMKRQFDRLAFEVLQRLCEIANSKPDLEKRDLELISLMHDEIANVLFNRKEYLNAANHYESSFKIKVKVTGMKSLKIGYLLLALGKAYYMASEYQKALHRFSSGLDVIESIEGRNTIYSANISLTMAKIQYALKDYKKAIQFYERSLDIYSKVMGYGHPYCLRIYANLIFVCFESGHTDKALEIANRILNMIKEMNNAEVFTMLNEIGNIYRKNEFFSEALNFYEIALEKLAHANQKEISTEAVNLVYTNIGSAHFHLHNYDEALQYYKEAAKYFGRVDNGVNVHAVSIYINIVRLYKVLGKSNEAGAYLKKATGVLTLLEGDAVTKQNEESMQKLKHDLTALKKN